MMERTLAKRYARALLAVTEKVEDTEATLLALKTAYRENDDFRRLLVEPRVPKTKRKELLRKPFEGKIGKEFEEFLDLLVEKNRVDLIPEIADAFDRLADATRGVVRVKVKSWRPIDEATRKALHDKLAAVIQRKIEIEDETDASLKGGMLVQIGDSVIDGSVANRLKALKERLYEIERR